MPPLTGRLFSFWVPVFLPVRGRFSTLALGPGLAAAEPDAPSWSEGRRGGCGKPLERPMWLGKIRVGEVITFVEQGHGMGLGTRVRQCVTHV